MIEWLYSIDVAVFHFLNGTLSNPVGDAVWPIITDYIQLWPIRVALLVVWIFLMVKGGKRGRTVALLLIPVLLCADKLSSAVIKELISRARPCHEVNGIPIVQGIHLLVDCGPGKSFPSSHAVNNFAMATLFSFYYRRYTWAFVLWASLVALSRPIVGVHYPSDILGGAVIGVIVAAFVIACWRWIVARYIPSLKVGTKGDGPE